MGIFPPNVIDMSAKAQRACLQDDDLLERIMARELPIAVLGLGHVGLPTALGLADMGWVVLGADSDPEKVARIRSGDPCFYEPGIPDLLGKELAAGRFKPVDDLASAIRSASVLFICVGTPQHENGEADLSQVESVARTIAQNLNGYKLIVEKSTVPAVTAQWIKRTIQRYSTNGKHGNGRNGNGAHGNGNHGNGNGNHGRGNNGHGIYGDGSHADNFDVASNPEFLQEGCALHNVFHPDRLICGVESERAREILTAIYAPLKSPIVITDLNSAELTKHASNSFLAMKISFINMVADLCEAVGADVTKVAKGIGADPRIGPQFLQAGIGFGGYCFPKDLRAFIHLAEEYGVDASLLKEVGAVNQERASAFVRKVRKALWILRDKKIGVLGLAFKADTDDIREAPSLSIIRALLQEGATVQLYDPRAVPNFQRLLPPENRRVTYCKSAYEAAWGVHALLILTEWKEFKELDFQQLYDVMEVPVLVDGRNLLDPTRVRDLGFEYWSIGR